MNTGARTIEQNDAKFEMAFEVGEWIATPGGWTVEAIGSDGEIYQAFFYGPKAKERAEEYATFKSIHQ